MAASSYYDFTYMDFLANHFDINNQIMSFEDRVRVLQDRRNSVGVVDYSKIRVQSGFNERAFDRATIELAELSQDVEYLRKKYNAFDLYFRKSIRKYPNKEAIVLHQHFLNRKSPIKAAAIAHCSPNKAKEVIDDYKEKYSSYSVDWLHRS